MNAKNRRIKIILAVAASMAGVTCLGQEKTKYEILTEQQTVYHAAKLMDSYLTNDTTKQIATKYAIGGTFPKSHFVMQNTLQGIAMWYCFNRLTGKLYVAIEKGTITDFSGKKFPESPLTRRQNIPKLRSLSYYDNSTAGGAESFLNKDTNYDSKDPVRKLKRTQTRGKRFKSMIDRRDLDQTLNLESGFAFFQNNEHLIDSLYHQKGTEYIRYYFGYNPGNCRSRLRILLFSVDQSGKNILQVPLKPHEKDKEKVKYNALVLQRSIPPK